MTEEQLKQIRERERNSHITMYSNLELYKEGSWLGIPIRTVIELFPHFARRTELRVLDLGCGVGRNCISIARQFRDIQCVVDCVDILDFSIDKLTEYAKNCDVSAGIRGTVGSIEEFPIPHDHYDWILAVSSLEHVESQEVFLRKLTEIKEGIRKNGIVCLVINSNVREFCCSTGCAVPPQFEVNFPTGELQTLLELTFAGWRVIKSTQREQQYEIPREAGINLLHTTVVTFVAEKPE